MGRDPEQEFREALKKDRIIPFAAAPRLVKKELDAAATDLDEAKDRFKNERFKYATITAYYSMFHSARALLYSRKLREKSHYYLLVAMKALFVKTGLLDENLVREFHEAMVLREEADYHGEFSKAGAERALNAAISFIEASRKIITEKK
jgi:uncharacterized protein (UPF0332 family)